jgi:hypothetical protein
MRVLCEEWEAIENVNGQNMTAKCETHGLRQITERMVCRSLVRNEQ